MNSKEFRAILGRRRFLEHAGYGLGTLALGELMAQEAKPSAADERSLNALAPRTPHSGGKAKSVIFLFMGGGPSQMDLLYHKPKLNEYHGRPLPESLQKDLAAALAQRPSTSADAKVLGTPWSFKRYGQSGLEFSELLPHMANVADEFSMVRSVDTDVLNHTPAQAMLMGGSPQFGRPTIGAWVLYGLGSESQNLPGYVVLTSAGAVNGAENWTNGFLPAVYRGVEFRGSGDPILFLSNPNGLTMEMQRKRLDAIRDLNQIRYSSARDMEIAARIHSYELAFRMQTSGPELADLSQESKGTLEMYGLAAGGANAEPVSGGPGGASARRGGSRQAYARNCLLARRLVERGVRYVMLVHYAWDHHSNLHSGIKEACLETDRATAALISDLKQRGLLDSTLVVWGGEFGRTSTSESGDGRDHNHLGFTVWLAGAGVRGGTSYGATDDFGFRAVQDKVHVHDLHATILHLLGIDHERLTFRHAGRDYRLTDVYGRVVRDLLA